MNKKIPIENQLEILGSEMNKKTYLSNVYNEVNEEEMFKFMNSDDQFHEHSSSPCLLLLSSLNAPAGSYSEHDKFRDYINEQISNISEKYGVDKKHLLLNYASRIINSMDPENDEAAIQKARRLYCISELTLDSKPITNDKEFMNIVTRKTMKYLKNDETREIGKRLYKLLKFWTDSETPTGVGL